MSNFLTKLLKEKRNEIKIAKAIELRESITEKLSVSNKVRSFKESIKTLDSVKLIAEIKFKSPSKGLFRSKLKPEVLAKIYENSGAAAISVLTDRKFFGGDIGHLSAVRQASSLPILRKDFIIDEYQIYESKAFGADAILLIARLLSERELKEFFSLSVALGMDVMVEVHSEAELKKAMAIEPEIIGINNRNLENFQVDLKVTERLVKKISKDIVKVSESGIRSHKDILYLKNLGVDAVLIGETFMRSKNVAGKVKEIMGEELRL